MKLNTKIMAEAERAARNPQSKFLLLGVFCGVMVPTLYARHTDIVPRLSSRSITYLESLTRDNEAKTPLEIEEENMLISSIL